MKRLSLLLNIIMIFMSVLPVSANEENLVSFGVQGILPENQTNDQVTYFDIEMEPGQEQVLEVIITNDSDAEIEVAVSSNSAATNSNGVITYDGSQEDYQANMAYPFSDISEVEEEVVKVPAKGQASAFINVKAPDESFDGQILGGLRFLLKNEADENASGVSIQNQYAYSIAVNITEKGNDTEVEPDLVLDSVSLEEINHRDGLQTTFKNPQPVMISGLSFEGHIYPENNSEPIYSRQVENFMVAPNNQFHFPITFDDGNLEPGNYIFQGTASNDDYEWEFEEEFTVAEDNN